MRGKYHLFVPEKLRLCVRVVQDYCDKGVLHQTYPDTRLAYISVSICTGGKPASVEIVGHVLSSRVRKCSPLPVNHPTVTKNFCSGFLAVWFSIVRAKLQTELQQSKPKAHNGVQAVLFFWAKFHSSIAPNKILGHIFLIFGG